MIRNTRFHRWRHAQRLVNPAKVVMEKMQCARVLVVLTALAESVRQPRKTPVAHAERQILAFNERG